MEARKREGAPEGAPNTAVEVGFEPTDELPHHTLSRRAPSATRRLHQEGSLPEVGRSSVPSAAEEFGEQGGAFVGEDAGDDFGAVVEPAVAYDVPEGADGPGLGVEGAEDDVVEPGE